MSRRTTQVPEQDPRSDFIRHVVFFSAKNPDDIDRIVDGLTKLAEIPSVKHFEVSRNRNEDRFGNEVDVIVYAEFEDDAALTAYRAHQIYQDCIDIVRPLRDLRIAADF
ncbi:Dabb family protein [Sulfitobacter mediterraneus]|uniref:Dabb family protein n=1 Tax=Sulfitobacter mediterraneus TaxID=83219 RepID=UPI0019396B9E|nr:Dabb family protein [Sulfitobacter mediterraneus]MBM1558265.1 Dabb family protein [Sulfitobacter mediterraneus]MBM1568635.1 Dabb family protein [Sulfitobacter mediterraneus]MBM1573471.1 Dabb family protein [Sulfitobacter mediterraneus]MBM1576364.1 Dabb family protein [Sulfitobacter mediterraneus]MBM1581254.1 Dabb family protein [Sulfitobacter mediterraneus]